MRKRRWTTPPTRGAHLTTRRRHHSNRGDHMRWTAQLGPYDQTFVVRAAHQGGLYEISFAIEQRGWRVQTWLTGSNACELAQSLTEAGGAPPDGFCADAHF